MLCRKKILTEILTGSNAEATHFLCLIVKIHKEIEPTKWLRYKIKQVKGIDDYAMIREALGRMLVALKEGRETFIPDVIMIDGGKGHLNTALRVLREQEFENTELISIAKRFETSGKVFGFQPVHQYHRATIREFLEKECLIHFRQRTINSRVHL